MPAKWPDGQLKIKIAMKNMDLIAPNFGAAFHKGAANAAPFLWSATWVVAPGILIRWGMRDHMNYRVLQFAPHLNKYLHYSKPLFLSGWAIHFSEAPCISQL
jgi:hypothetical protein